MNAAERADLVRKIAAVRAAGVTVFLVEHDIGLVMGISDYVNVLDHGRLICSGTPEAVRCDEAVIEAYLGTGRERGAGVARGCCRGARRAAAAGSRAARNRRAGLRSPQSRLQRRW